MLLPGTFYHTGVEAGLRAGGRVVGSIGRVRHPIEDGWLEGGEGVAVVGAGPVAGGGGEYSGGCVAEVDWTGAAGGCAGVYAVLDERAPCDGYAGVYGSGDYAGADW